MSGTLQGFGGDNTGEQELLHPDDEKTIQELSDEIKRMNEAITMIGNEEMLRTRRARIKRLNELINERSSHV